MKQLFSNNFETTLAAAITSTSATTMTLIDANGMNNPSTDEYELVTLVEEAKLEVVKVTARSGNTITAMVRAQEGTTAQTFSSGSTVYSSFTSGSIEKLRDRTQAIYIPVGDETTAQTVGTAKVTFRMPFAFELVEARANLAIAGTGADFIIDINMNGTSIFSTNITIDDGEKTSITAGTAAVITTTSLMDDAEMTVDVDQVGATTAGSGLKIALIGNRYD